MLFLLVAVCSDIVSLSLEVICIAELKFVRSVMFVGRLVKRSEMYVTGFGYEYTTDRIDDEGKKDPHSQLTKATLRIKKKLGES